ncbi:aromatic ring-hydroxylating oxygenase subunit alpha [Streptomyces wuyuanensis]|uniref:aromatic ring-hydroxylating oxygenase subunit alpha n=1 Tax=Streptomyces wuyuanensis TaxID=1196353 RepID=UPI003445E8D3
MSPITGPMSPVTRSESELNDQAPAATRSSHTDDGTGNGCDGTGPGPGPGSGHPGTGRGIGTDDGNAGVGALLGELSRVAGLPLERGETLPSAVYTSSAFHRLERERIFRGEWLCVGHVDQVASPGDYLRVDLPGDPLVVTRDEGGELHALSRVCRHRFMDVLPPEAAPERGSLKRLTCPYHTWTYKLNGEYAGQLHGAPLMNRVEFDRAACRLPRRRLEVWQGLIMVNADPSAEPLAPQLAGLAERLAPYRLADLAVAYTARWDGVPANWKVAVENGAESYHHLGTHAGTLEPVLPGRDTVLDDCEGRWFTAFMPFAPAAAEALGEDAARALSDPAALIPGLGEAELSGMLIAGVFPQLVMAFLPTGVTCFRWLPTGPQTHDALATVFVPAAARESEHYGEFLRMSRAQLELVQGEDLIAVRGVQRGLATDPAPSGGRFSHLERPLWQFQRYLASRLTEAVPSDGPPTPGPAA